MSDVAQRRAPVSASGSALGSSGDRPDIPAPLAPELAIFTDDLSVALPALLPRLWRFALRLAGDRHDAEDLVQRACVRALERRHQLQPDTTPLSWLFSIVHSIWLNEVRARQIRSHASMQWNDDIADTAADPVAANPETQTFLREIVGAVERLPDAQRAVMLLVAVEGLSYREAATALAIPIGTVMSRLARARLTIGAAFGDQSRTARARGPADAKDPNEFAQIDHAEFR